MEHQLPATSCARVVHGFKSTIIVDTSSSAEVEDDSGSTIIVDTSSNAEVEDDSGSTIIVDTSASSAQGQAVQQVVDMPQLNSKGC
jgi:hypothetical protein